MKGQRGDAIRPKARKAPTTQVSSADLQKPLDQRTHELDEALEQQTATAEILKVISRSTFDLQTVFDTIVVNAVRLCHAHMGAVHRFDGEQIHIVAHHNFPPEAVEVLQRMYPRPPQPDQASGRAILTCKVAEIEDMLADPHYTRKVTVAGQWGSILAVPMLRDGTPIGAIVITRNEVGRFAGRDINLLKTFADQAVIAIENTRLLNELRQRTDDLTESLEQQTATSEVLKVISSSPGELEPVFQTMLENATRICEATFGTMLLVEGDSFRRVALHNASPMFAEFHSKVPVVQPQKISHLRDLVETKRVVHIADQATVNSDDPITKYAAARTVLIVPLLKDNDLIGAFGIYRQEVRPFTDKQIKLVENFAAQAVIAIENTRLLSELRESLQQQTATADVLKVISRSTFDLQTVLNTLVESAAQLCEADLANIWRPKDGAYRLAASYGVTSRYKEYLENKQFLETIGIEPGRGTVVGRTLLEGKTVHVPDVQADPDYKLSGVIGGYRTMLGVPLLRQGVPIGVIVLNQSIVRPFTDKQIELVETFADQAVIAIENVRLFDEVQARTSELSESLEQQTATSEVLKVISSSPGELKPVFDTMLINAMQVCEAKFGFMHRYEDDHWETMALQCDVPAYAEFVQKARFGPESIVGRIASTKQVAQVADITATQRYADRDPLAVAAAEIGGVRTILGVPLLKENEVKGAIILYRQEVRPFTNKQIELVQNFAAQAVIAIENARLLSELRESLQQQTATADVLKVISSSPGDLGPVFDTMLANAVHVCGANFGIMHRYDGGAFCNVAMHNVPPAFAEMRRSNPVIRPSPGTGLGRVERTKKVVQILDLKSEQTYRDRVPATVAMVELAGARTLLLVPMLKDDVLLGTIAIYRQEVRPFSDKQIELVENFSAQAVIAIENTRLLNELRESLEQQTATSEVLKVISSSPGELEPVFNAMLANATRICEATIGTLYLREGSRFRGVALHHSKQSYVDFWRRNPVVDVEKNPGIPLARLARTKRVVHLPDLRTDQSYIEKNDRVVVLVEQGDVRTFVAVPMLKEGELIGAINLYRQEVQPFTDKQIGLVQNFAAQAVIAIENTRLLSELRESLQQQTATADVLKVISRSAFDLNAVLHALIEAAARLCDADHGNIARERDGVYQRVATYGYSDDFTKHLMNLPVIPDRGTGTGRSLLEGKVVHIHDVRADPEYTFVEAQKRGDFRTVLSVPMLREGTTIGILALTRRVVRPFTDKQIELVRTFADQAAIAIENVRLFESVEARTRELAKSLEDLRNTQDRLVQTQKLASLGQLTAGIAHEIKNPLNFVNNFSAVSVELIDELRQALTGAHLDTKLRAEISEIADTLQGNLDKVVQHGKRADAIVKNMLLHSREGSGEHRLVDINAVVEESLNLAYHGARAEKQDFNITLQQSLDPAAGEVDVFPQDITRVLLNLISNGFYAATKRRAETNGGDYEPTLSAGTRSLGDRVEITIRDNGAGIPPDVKEKMFNPFFTTKPAGEGTGLGLSISHDIIVKQHGGSIEVETRTGEFTEIRIILPRAGVSQPTAH